MEIFLRNRSSMYSVIHWKRWHHIGVIITCQSFLIAVLLSWRKCSINIIRRLRMMNKSTWSSRITNKEKLSKSRCIVSAWFFLAHGLQTLTTNNFLTTIFQAVQLQEWSKICYISIRRWFNCVKKEWNL